LSGLLYDHPEAQQDRRATLIDDSFGNMRLQKKSGKKKKVMESELLASWIV
jgi:hypothetical protein